MLPSEVTQTTAAAASSASAESVADVGREDFLRMLIAQLENQDPLNPQEATEFTAQLAQFSSLEQLISMRLAIDELSSSLSASDGLGAIPLIGREVLAESPHFALDGQGEGATLRFDLAGFADATSLEIADAGGRVVASLDLGPRPAGVNAVAWDGRDRLGNALPAGVYTAQVQALSGATPIQATSLVQALVSGTSLTGENPVLMLGDVVVPLSTVREVRSADGAGATP